MGDAASGSIEVASANAGYPGGASVRKPRQLRSSFSSGSPGKRHPRNPVLLGGIRDEPRVTLAKDGHSHLREPRQPVLQSPPDALHECVDGRDLAETSVASPEKRNAQDETPDEVVVASQTFDFSKRRLDAEANARRTRRTSSLWISPRVVDRRHVKHPTESSRLARTGDEAVARLQRFVELVVPAPAYLLLERDTAACVANRAAHPLPSAT